MASGEYCPLLAPLLLLLLHAVGVEGVMCVRYSWVLGQYSSTYCEWGCCGDDYNHYCCERSSNVGVIIGAVAGALLGLAGLVCLIALCVSWKAKTTNNIRPTGQPLYPYSGPVVSMAVGTTVAPPPYSPAPPPPYKPLSPRQPPPPYQHQDPASAPCYVPPSSYPAPSFSSRPPSSPPPVFTISSQSPSYPPNNTSPPPYGTGRAHW